MDSAPLKGAPCTSGKNGNMLFFASGVSKWILVPSWKALRTWLAKQLSRLNQRMSCALAPAWRGSTPRYTGSVVSKPKCFNAA